MSKYEASYTRVTITDDHIYAMLADVASRRRDPASIAKYAPLAEQQALQNGHILHQAVAHRAWGVFHLLEGEYAESEVRLQKALEIFKELDTKWQLGRTFFELGELAEKIQDPETAQDHYSNALKFFEDMKAVPAIAKTKKRLKTLPV